MVLVALGVARVGESGPVGLPRHAAGTGVRDCLAQIATVVASEHAQHGMLRPALARADGDERAVQVTPRTSRRRSPSRPRRRRGRAAHRCGGGVGRRPAGQDELLGTGRALEAEQPVAADLCRHDDGELHQRDEALAPPGPIGQGIERLTGVRVLGRHPLLHLRRVTRLQPAVGSGTSTPWRMSKTSSRRRRRRGHRLVVSRDPGWGACRGWPWSGAAGPYASSSSWTWGSESTGGRWRSLRTAVRPRCGDQLRARRGRPSG